MITVGADNDYGHPPDRLLDLLRAAVGDRACAPTAGHVRRSRPTARAVAALAERATSAPSVARPVGWSAMA